MQLIAPDLYTVSGAGLGRVYLIKDADGFTMIDTASPFSADKIMKRITDNGHAPESIKRILITHAHYDHVGGLPAIKAATNAPVWASAIEKPVIEGNEPVTPPPSESLPFYVRPLRPAPVKFEHGVPVDRVLSDGDILPEIFGGLHVIHAPGHTRGQIIFWQPARKILICGDVMMHAFGKLRLPLLPYTLDMDMSRRTIGKLAAELQPEIICFGHGTPITQNATAQFQAFAERIRID